MNYLNEKLRILKHSVTHYEKMAMLARNSSDRIKYKRKAKQCQDELNYMLKGVLEL